MSEIPTTNTAKKKYRNTPPICSAIRLQSLLQYFWCPYVQRKRKHCQYSSHWYRGTPPICIAIRLPFVSQYFWEILVVVVTRIFPNKRSQTQCDRSATGASAQSTPPQARHHGWKIFTFSLVQGRCSLLRASPPADGSGSSFCCPNQDLLRTGLSARDLGQDRDAQQGSLLGVLAGDHL